MTADSLKLTAITQDVGNAVEELDAALEGTELTVAFNPDYFAAGVEAVGSDEVTLETLDALEAGRAPRRRQGRVPLPADARPGSVDDGGVTGCW